MSSWSGLRRRGGERVTYIDYLNDFNRWLETNDLPCNSQIMYFKLLHIFNRAGWPESIQVDNLRMALLIGAESKGTVIRARDKLVAAGFIEFQPGRKGSPNCYRLKKQSQNVTTNATVSETVSATTNEPHIKTIRQKTNTPLPPQGKTGFGNDLQDAFESWLSYKAEKRQPYKPTGLKCLITEIRNNAQKYGEAAVANLIRECMASNWTGIIFNKLKSGGTTQTTSEPPPRQYDAATDTWR